MSRSAIETLLTVGIFILWIAIGTTITYFTQDVTYMVVALCTSIPIGFLVYYIINKVFPKPEPVKNDGIKWETPEEKAARERRVREWEAREVEINKCVKDRLDSIVAVSEEMRLYRIERRLNEINDKIDKLDAKIDRVKEDAVGDIRAKIRKIILIVFFIACIFSLHFCVI